VGGTAADPLWKSDAVRHKHRAEYWEGKYRALHSSGAVTAEAHSVTVTELQRAREKHDKATKHISHLTRRVLELDAQLDGAREACEAMRAEWMRAKRELEFRARVIASQKTSALDLQTNRDRWESRYSQLAGAALHMVRRLNALTGKPDAAEFTGQAASEAVDKVRDEIKRLVDQRDDAQSAANDNGTHLAELRGRFAATERERDTLQSRLTALQTNSQCPVLSPASDTDVVRTIIERKCVRVNGHSGAHIRTNGDAW
jgi:chromosome segregation ATPase